MQFPALVSQTQETGCRMPLGCCNVENPEKKSNPRCPEQMGTPCPPWQCQEGHRQPWRMSPWSAANQAAPPQREQAGLTVGIRELTAAQNLRGGGRGEKGISCPGSPGCTEPKAQGLLSSHGYFLSTKRMPRSNKPGSRVHSDKGLGSRARVQTLIGSASSQMRGLEQLLDFCCPSISSSVKWGP